MNVKLLSIGMFVFAMKTLAFDEFERSMDFRFARNARVGDRDALQFVGRDDQISLQGSSYAELGDGRASIDALEEMAGQGKAWPVVDGTGRVFGNFIIERIRERGTAIIEGGIPLKIDFAIDLVRADDTAAA